MYSHPPTVRTATLADCGALASLAGELGYPVAEAEMRQRMSRLSNRPEQAVFVAEADVVMGWIHVGIVESLESGRFAEIFGLVVGDMHRGRKIGTALLRAAEQWASGQGCRELRVRSNVTRTRARRFYETHGYSVAKTQHVFVKPL